ncbi:hypothetical protein [Paenibacillus campi]|uniref:hypothetical protein n=1 Tax=Paenibacillus campi TaxID=3106031 RepID=UPI003A4C712B
MDLSIFINTPLDVAMARRIIRDFENKPMEIINDMRFYLSHARLADVNMIKQVKSDADIVLDGSLSVDKCVEKIMAELESNDRL